MHVYFYCVFDVLLAEPLLLWALRNVLRGSKAVGMAIERAERAEKTPRLQRPGKFRWGNKAISYEQLARTR